MGNRLTGCHSWELKQFNIEFYFQDNWELRGKKWFDRFVFLELVTKLVRFCVFFAIYGRECLEETNCALEYVKLS